MKKAAPSPYAPEAAAIEEVVPEKAAPEVAEVDANAEAAGESEETTR